MSTEDIKTKIVELAELEAMKDELNAEIENLKDSLKAHMDSIGVEELEAGTHIIRYTTVLTQRFNSTAFKKALPDVYTAFLKQSTSRRFTIS